VAGRAVGTTLTTGTVRAPRSRGMRLPVRNRPV